MRLSPWRGGGQQSALGGGDLRRAILEEVAIDLVQPLRTIASPNNDGVDDPGSGHRRWLAIGHRAIPSMVIALPTRSPSSSREHRVTTAAAGSGAQRAEERHGHREADGI